MAPADFKLLCDGPIHVYFVVCPPDIFYPSTRVWETDLATTLLIDNHECEFRGVSCDRMRTVLTQGIDVTPTTSHFYAACPDKALEYGGWPKTLMALRRDCLKRTFIELPAGTSNEELAITRQEYPTMIELKDGSGYYFSRLAEDHVKFMTPYEWDYMWWIPGDPRAALKAVYILVRPEDASNLRVLPSS